MAWQVSPGRIYGLSFRPPNTEAGIARPEIVLTVSNETAARLEELLESRKHRFVDQTYVPESEPIWQDSQSTLDPGFSRWFGYGKCAYVEESDAESRYYFPLIPVQEGCIALTLSLAFLFLDLIRDESEEEYSSNRQQLMTFSTRCENRPEGWGHMIGGYAYPTMRAWLSRTAESGTDDPLASVRDAMRLAYLSLDPEYGERLADVCDARLHASGRFLLECPGNACDVAIYPDNDYGPNHECPTTISCHNLDWARQQLTLLAGLAALHQLAEADLG